MPMPDYSTLAQRLGMTIHVSPLRIRLLNLMRSYPSRGAQCLEDWLLDIANARGAGIVVRVPAAAADFVPPPLKLLPNEELIVAICQPHNLDRPQILRVAAQLVSRQVVDAGLLIITARRERAERVLAELARQALHVAPDHALWNEIMRAFPGTAALRSPVIHWTRLAIPVPDERGCNANSWRLVA